MAPRLPLHISWRATTVVTASGGGVQLWDMAALIWEYLKPPRIAMIRRTTASMRNIRFFMAKREGTPAATISA